MNKGLYKRLIATIIAISILVPVCAFAATSESETTIREGSTIGGTIRVYLRSLGAPDSITVTLNGNYSSRDPYMIFDRGSTLTFAISEGKLLMRCGTAVFDVGTSIFLKRSSAESDSDNGLYIQEAAKNNIYNGDLIVKISSDGTLAAILYIEIEEYLYGVVPYEMSDSWPLEALKAQAVAARTYVLQRRMANKSATYDVTDTTSDQVFKGCNAANVNAKAAVDQTAGIICMYKDNYATCYYGASNGGQTAMPDEVWGSKGDFGYLDVHDDAYDLENSRSVVRTYTISTDGAMLDDDMTELLKTAAEKNDIRIISIDSVETANPKGRAESRMYQDLNISMTICDLTVVEPADSDTEEEISDEPAEIEYIESDPYAVSVTIGLYTQMKSTFPILKINSGDYELYTVSTICSEESFEPEVTGYQLEARRFGHGVGMSQRGAQVMAGNYDFSFIDILKYYYPGADLVRMSFTEEPLQTLDELPRDLHAYNVLPSLLDGELLGTVYVGHDGTRLNVRSAPNTEGRILETLPDGEKVIICETLDGWYRIITARVKGYVSADYIILEEQ